MQCRNCGFENIEGRENCFRCSASLMAAPQAFQVPPPHRLKRAARPVYFILNRLDEWIPSDLLQDMSSFVVGDGLSQKAYTAMLFSIIPGLGHLIQKRFLEAVFFFILWLSAGLTCINFYSNWVGGLALGSVFCWPAVAGIHAARHYMPNQSLAERIRMMGVIQAVALTLCCLCFFQSRYVVQLPRVNNDIPRWGIRAGDTLMALSSTDKMESGTLALVQVKSQWITGSYYRINEADVVVPVIAKSGDQIHIEKNKIRVNGKIVPPAMLPNGPLPFPKTPMRFTIPKESIFALFPINIQIGNDVQGQTVAFNAIWTKAYIFQERDVFGSISRIYLPLSRRGPLPSQHVSESTRINNNGG